MFAGLCDGYNRRTILSKLHCTPWSHSGRILSEWRRQSQHVSEPNSSRRVCTQPHRHPHHQLRAGENSRWRAAIRILGQTEQVAIRLHMCKGIVVPLWWWQVLFQRTEGEFTRNEIQPVTEIGTDIILYWRIEFWCKWIHRPFSSINRLEIITN